MSSSTITIKPRRRTAQSPPPTALSANQNKGTVLLRNPLPKYSFQKKPGPKKENKVIPDEKEDKVEKKYEISFDNKDAQKIIEPIRDEETKSPITTVTEPVTVCKLVGSFPQIEQSPELRTEPSASKKVEIVETNLKDKPVNKVGPISKPTEKTLSHSVSDSVIGVQNNLESISIEQISNSAQIVSGTPSTSFICETNDNHQTVSSNTSPPQVSGLTCTQIPGSCSCSERLRHLEEEKQLLKNQLEVQLQVNQELKKLLVASVGDDLQHRVEKLTRDKALLSLELGDYCKKITDDYEHLDKISIQADMWRSKFLASRVMTDELASSKAFYMMQFQECQTVVQKLLNERHQLRANLYDVYRGLTQIQEAFDPLGSQTVGTRLLTSKNTIDLARTNQHLVETIKYRLLPSHVTSSMSNKMETDWHDYLTQAEAHAQELLTREMRPEDFRCLIPARSIMAAPGSLSVDRYHPCANYDNLTLNVCCKCKGEISIV